MRGFAFRAREAVLEQAQNAGARRRHSFRRRAGTPHADAFAAGAEMLAHAQRHAQNRAARAQRVGRHPIDEIAQLRLERRNIEPLIDVLELVVEAGTRGAFAPDHAGAHARPERY